MLLHICISSHLPYCEGDIPLILRGNSWHLPRVCLHNGTYEYHSKYHVNMSVCYFLVTSSSRVKETSFLHLLKRMWVAQGCCWVVEAAYNPFNQKSNNKPFLNKPCGIIYVGSRMTNTKHVFAFKNARHHTY